MIKIQKRAVKFYNTPKKEVIPKPSITNNHLQRDEPGEESPKQAGPRALFTNSPPQSPKTATQLDPTKSWENKKIITWHIGKNLPKKLSKLECYLALKRPYTVAENLTTVTEPNLRKALTMYRLSEHSLAIEWGISLLLSEADVGRPGSQEKIGYVHTAYKIRWKLSCTS